jgi:pimeloyl-ACP methyl ester carboxylesterase
MREAMTAIIPHVRTAGRDGPVVVAIHCSAGNGRQWNRLADLLQAEFQVHAVDLHGHGGTPAWEGARTIRLTDEVALLESLLDTVPEGVHLVGHSYGAAVALKLACMHPTRVRSVTTYEPVLFRLLIEDDLRHPATQEALVLGDMTAIPLALGFNELSARHFIDFWSGKGAWDAMTAERRRQLAAQMTAVVPHFAAVFHDPLSCQDLSRLQLPALCLTGAHTQSCTRRIGELLRAAMPRATHEALPALGHMGPVTHADRVAQRIAAFLAAQQACAAMLSSPGETEVAYRDAQARFSQEMSP